MARHQRWRRRGCLWWCYSLHRLDYGCRVRRTPAKRKSLKSDGSLHPGSLANVSFCCKSVRPSPTGTGEAVLDRRDCLLSVDSFSGARGHGFEGDKERRKRKSIEVREGSVNLEFVCHLCSCPRKASKHLPIQPSSALLSLTGHFHLAPEGRVRGLGLNGLGKIWVGVGMGTGGGPLACDPLPLALPTAMPPGLPPHWARSELPHSGTCPAPSCTPASGHSGLAAHSVLWIQPRPRRHCRQPTDRQTVTVTNKPSSS